MTWPLLMAEGRAARAAITAGNSGVFAEINGKEEGPALSGALWPVKKSFVGAANI